MKWVYELPDTVRKELMTEAEAILVECGYTGESLREALNTVANEKLINIIGHEYGLLDADKYAQYIF